MGISSPSNLVYASNLFDTSAGSRHRSDPFVLLVNTTPSRLLSISSKRLWILLKKCEEMVQTERHKDERQDREVASKNRLKVFAD